MTAAEVTALGRLAARTAAGTTDRIRELHSAIAERAFAGVGETAEPARALHDEISSLAYGSVRFGLRAGLSGGGLLAAGVLALRSARRPRPTGPEAPAVAPLVQRGGTAAPLALLNGWFGDRLHAEDDPLATPMALWSGERPVGEPATEPATGQPSGHPEPTGRLVVFLHGLVETERSWRPKPGSDGVCFGEELRTELGCTPLWVRYNTGLRVSENGRLLSDLLERTVAGWPVPVTDVVLVGHSMGGLVARSALQHAVTTDPRVGWPELLQATVSLGVPHLGAPLERAVNRTVHVLRRLPETRPLATVLSVRSDGIKDLRHGNLVEPDWAGHDPEHPHDRRSHVPLHPGSPHFVVYSTLTARPDHPLAQVLGDVMVLPRSATGHDLRHGPWNLPTDQVLHLGGLHHLDLLHHRRVHAQLRSWLAGVLTPEF